MGALLDRTTLLVVVTSCIAALLCVLPATRGVFPFWVMAAGLHIADTLFHELGHTVASWLFGRPAVPMIFTLFGADQAGGMSMRWNFSWLVQGVAYGVLAYGCFWLKENARFLLVPMLAFSVAVVGVSLSRYPEVVISYMGHGGSILVGGVLLFRTWIYLDARNQYERWLNGLFGFFLIFYNFAFSLGLLFNASLRGAYSDHVAFGITHNDFEVIASAVPGWSVEGVAFFTLIYCVVMIIVSFICAIFLSDDFEDVYEDGVD